MVPSPPKPVINDLTFYGQGNSNDFQYCCEFYIRNDGEALCEIEKVEFELNDVVFTDKTSALLYVGTGGGGGGRYNFGGATQIEVISPRLPQTIPSSNHLFRIIGKADSKKKESNSESFTDSDTKVNVFVKFHFKSKNKQMKPIIEPVPVIFRQIQNMR